MATNNISTSELVRRNIQKLQAGQVFDYSFFSVRQEEELSLAKSLSRLAKDGFIVRVSKGRYYKPKTTTFGNLKPSENQIVTALTQKDNTKIGYVTGITVYNQLGLTTQLSNQIVIATINPHPSKEISGYRIKYVKRDFEFKESDIQLLQLLDAIKDIKKIPDVSINDALKILINKLKVLPAIKLKRLARLALNYNAATRALTGALIEYYAKGISISSLYKSLNSFSKYEMKISNTLLPNQLKWNIE